MDMRAEKEITVVVADKTEGSAMMTEGVCPRGVWRRVWDLYADGFRNMTVGRYLWVIILAKLVVLFLVFKLFFFPNLLARDYDNDEDRAQAVRSHLIEHE